jgi:hypothetical protein
MPVATTLCDRVSGTVSAQRGYYRANLRGAWTASRLSGGRGAQLISSRERNNRVLSIQRTKRESNGVDCD